MNRRAQLDRPELLPLWETLHQRLSSGRAVTRVRFGPLDETAQAALADLLGLDRMPGERPSIALDRLDTAVRDACGLSTRELVGHLVGPVGNRTADAADLREAREALWTWLDTHEVVTAQPALKGWVEHLRNTGMLGSSTPAAKRCAASALKVLGALPADGEPLPVLAARLLDGDAHALDDGTRLSSCLLRALSVLHDVPIPESAEARRALWSLAGVADDELSSTVLTAGLRPHGDSLAAQIARLCAQSGQAASLTLAQLRAAGPLTLEAPQVHVVENPSIVALALRRFSDRCPPLVCTSGWPNTAVIRLLRLLSAQDTELHYHGDFDGEGIRIAAHVIAKTSAKPWRMTEQDYRTAVTQVQQSGPPPGRLTPAPWDPSLTSAMEELGSAVMEEVVADTLLDDLALRA